MGQQPRQALKTTGKANPQAFRPAAVSRKWGHDRSSGSRASSQKSTVQFEVPPTPEAATKQVEAALREAYESGRSRQIINALLPLTGATDLDDWPGGIRQQFKAAQPLVEQLLKSLRSNADLDGKLQVQLLDQGDAVGAWYNDNMLVVIFPTGDTIDKIQQMAEGKKLTLLINPQWAGGQVVSDFGVFNKRRREEYVASFETTYSFMNKRIRGEDVRLLLINGVVQVFVLEGQEFTFVQEYDREPSYAELEDVLKARDGSNASKSLFERMQASFNWNVDSLKQPPQSKTSDQ